MKYKLTKTATVTLTPFIYCSSLFASNKPAEAKPAAVPNILFILTDDLGYGDIGVFYQNARRSAGSPAHATPQIDRLASQGAYLTNHYCAAPVSAPSRASLISGLSQGHAGVRNNQFDWELPDNHTIATVLRQAGYATATIGKWGLHGKAGKAPNWPAHPLNRGFDYFYGYMRHVDGHEHYPKEHIYYKNNNDTIRLWDNKTDITAGLDKCYTTDLFAARAKAWIVNHEKTSPSQPFFMYLAFDTPHAVLELPTQAYPAGGGINGGIQWMGIPGHMINTASGTPDSWMHPDYANATYTSDGKEVPWPDINKRYATSVRRIDDAVGDLMQLLKDLNIDQNTLIVFTSDNGPSIESYLPESITPHFFASYGPFDGIKRDVWEGGLRVPAIAYWQGHITPDTKISAPCAMYDWLPTFAEVAHVVPPANTDGVSLIPNLTNNAATAPENGRGSHRPDDYLYFEYFFDGRAPDFPEFESSRRNRQRNQMQAIRMGDLMAVRYDVKSAEDNFEIYDVTNDPKQANDLWKKSENAFLQTQFKALALQSRRPLASASRPYDNDFVPSVVLSKTNTASGLSWNYYESDFPWAPDIAGLRPLKTGVSSTGADIASVPLNPDANAAVFFKGYIDVPVDGQYTFELTSNGGALLRLHAATVIDADYGYKPGEKRTATINLQAGLHPISLTYHTNGKQNHALTLRWSFPDAEFQDIPINAFFHSTN